MVGILEGVVTPPILARLIGQDVLHNSYYLPMIYALYCTAAMLALFFVPEMRNLI